MRPGADPAETHGDHARDALPRSIRRVVAPGDEILVHCHPHWRTLVRPALVLCAVSALLGLAVGVAGTQLAPRPRHLAYLVLLGGWALVVARGTLLPAARWVRTHLVVSDRAVVFRSGFRPREVVEVPLPRISAVRYRRTLADRAVGTGALIVECGYHPPLVVGEVPAVADVHAVLYDEVSRTVPYGARSDQASSLGGI